MYIFTWIGTAIVLAIILIWGYPPLNLQFQKFEQDTVQNLLLPLLAISLFKERAQEVFVTAWRQEGRYKRQLAVKRAHTEAARDTAELELSRYRAETGRYVSVASITAGVFISLAGVRVLRPLLVENATFAGGQEAWLFIVDVLLTAGLLAGGSEGIHSVMALLTDYLEKTRDRVKQDEVPEQPGKPSAQQAPPAGTQEDNAVTKGSETGKDEKQ